MLNYVIRRLLYALPVLLGIVVVVFLLVRMIPGDPCKAMLGERATAEACEAFYEANGLNEPIPVQLGIYLGKLVRGDLGESIRFSRPVAQILVERLPMTIELAVAALFLATVVGVGLGVAAAMRHNTSVDVATMALANVGVSMPVFWLGLMLQYLFAVILKGTPLALPPSGRLSAGIRPRPFYEVWGWQVDLDTLTGDLMEFVANHFIFNSLITGQWAIAWDAIVHLILPAVALSTIPMAIIARITRSSLLEVLGADYVRTARAKGALERRVVARHALRNALLPVVTIGGLQLGLLLGGAVLTETVFNLAGVGRALVEAIFARDFAVVQGVTVVVASSYVLVNLAVDISYAYLDPRIRLE
ncbi:MAG: peptide ABC transporter permease [Acidimicrobiia bacterium]|nr:MAG: peptide ABC transporter permease [Acidimicrobiia bacterium]